MQFAAIIAIASVLFAGNVHGWGDTLAHPTTGELAQLMAAWINAIADTCAGVSPTTSTTSSTISSTSSISSTSKTSTTSITTSSKSTTLTSTTSATSTCVHSICTTGTALKSACDPCAKQIIAQDSYCGSTSWDSTCVGEVSSICGITC
ncbi:hypothetical protein HDU76_008300 [Blyttiomyces sp. JEL0837]|nr:hypothetical protein HDU76_008300 [Blyttiomyces sp. JEL0837]